MRPYERNGMAKLTISEAARVAGVARSTLQRAIRTGRLSLSPDHTVDTAELLRAGYTLHAALQEQTAATLQDAASHSGSVQQDAPGPVPQGLSLLKQEMALLERERDLLRAALDAAAAREQVSLEREARLLHLLEQAQAQSHRLLEAPRTSAPARAPRTSTTVTAPGQSSQTAPVPDAPAEQAETVPEPFDPSKYVLGKLCPRGHNYSGTGHSLLRLSNRHCLACDREKFHERKQTPRRRTRADQMPRPA